MRPQPIFTAKYDLLPVEVFESNQQLGLAAALDARQAINQAIVEKGEASIILATGNSQLTFYRALRELGGIQWSKVAVFHMDQYLGIDPHHRASFPGFLQRHLLEAAKPRVFYPVPSDPDGLEEAMVYYESLLRAHPADLVVLGWGENGHIAFNDPPACFDDPQWVKIVQLLESARQQQVNEGHFDAIDEVPTQAVTLTVPALLASKTMLCLVPEARKADIVRLCLTQPVSEMLPGSILRTVSNARLYLDRDSAARL
jgi:glucosamine-6-phosphate deaminase